MDRIDSDTDTILRLTLATLIAFLLAGGGILISANNQVPIFTDTAAKSNTAINPHRLLQLLGDSSQQLETAKQIIPEHASSKIALASEPALPNVPALSNVPALPHEPTLTPEQLKRNALKHYPEHASGSVGTVALAIEPALPIEPSLTPEQLKRNALKHYPEHASGTVVVVAQQDKPALTPDQLKHNALFALRRMPNYYPSDLEYETAVAQLSKRIESQRLKVNVKKFLLSQPINDQSRLAELQMQPFFAEFDHTAFSEKQADSQVKAVYTGVGFPHIESNSRSAANRYKPYKQLMSFSDDASGDVVPYVRCMGLSPERVAKRAKQYNSQIVELALKHNVSASLIKAVVAKESCFNPKARSPVGAIGLMQLMPATAQWLKVKQPENPQQNLAAGVRYLSQLRKRFGTDELALAAYNAGPGNVERYHGIPPFNETENYVVDVMHFYRGYAATTRYVNAQNVSTQSRYYYP